MTGKKIDGGGGRPRRRLSGCLQGAVSLVAAILLADAVSGMPVIEEWVAWLA